MPDTNSVTGRGPHGLESSQPDGIETDSDRLDSATDTARKPGLDGMRAAMYAEMAKAVSGRRPWLERQRDCDTALEGAIHFLQKSGFSDAIRRQLLDEAAETRSTGDLHGDDTPVAERCHRLAAEFRLRVRHR